MSSRYIDLWRVDEPSSGFADRVAAAAMGDHKRRVTRRAAFGLAAAACAALAAWKVDRVLHPHLRELTAAARTEVELAPGAIAILERGARLLYNSAGARQLRGDVSYRVSPTTTLNVETPLGSLRGIGSCCRIKLAEVAGQTAALFVSVARGDLEVASANERAALHGGQYARVTSLAIDTEADDFSGDIARELDLPPPQRSVDVVPENRQPSPAPPPPTTPSGAPQGQKRAPSPRTPPSSAEAPSTATQPPADAGARTVIVPSCFCDRGDSLCACFH